MTVVVTNDQSCCPRTRPSSAVTPGLSSTTPTGPTTAASSPPQPITFSCLALPRGGRGGRGGGRGVGVGRGAQRGTSSGFTQ